MNGWLTEWGASRRSCLNLNWERWAGGGSQFASWAPLSASLVSMMLGSKILALYSSVSFSYKMTSLQAFDKQLATSDATYYSSFEHRDGASTQKSQYHLLWLDIAIEVCGRSWYWSHRLEWYHRLEWFQQDRTASQQSEPIERSDQGQSLWWTAVWLGQAWRPLWNTIQNHQIVTL